jgi:hypothetical protein
MENRELIKQVFDKHQINYHCDNPDYVDDSFGVVEDAINEIIQLKLNERAEIIMKCIESLQAAVALNEAVSKALSLSLK